MRFIFAAGAVLMAFVIPAKAELVFQGSTKVTSANKRCTAGPKVGTKFSGSFHPKTVGGVTQSWQGSALNSFSPFFARSWRLDGADFPIGSYVRVSNWTVSNRTKPASKPTRIKFANMIPAEIVSTTRAVTIVGYMKNPLGKSGQEDCVIGFIASGVAVHN